MIYLIIVALFLQTTINAESSEGPKAETSEKPQPKDAVPQANLRTQPVLSYENKDEYTVYDQITKQLFNRVSARLKNATNPFLEYKESKVQEKLFNFISHIASQIDDKVQHMHTVCLKFNNNDAFKAGYIAASITQFQRHLVKIYTELKSRKGELDELSLIAIFEQLNIAEKKLDILLDELVRTWRHRKIDLDSKNKNDISEYNVENDEDVEKR